MRAIRTVSFSAPTHVQTCGCVYIIMDSIHYRITPLLSAVMVIASTLSSKMASTWKRNGRGTFWIVLHNTCGFLGKMIQYQREQDAMSRRTRSLNGAMTPRWLLMILGCLRGASLGHFYAINRIRLHIADLRCKETLFVVR